MNYDWPVPNFFLETEDKAYSYKMGRTDTIHFMRNSFHDFLNNHALVPSHSGWKCKCGESQSAMNQQEHLIKEYDRLVRQDKP